MHVARLLLFGVTVGTMALVSSTSALAEASDRLAISVPVCVHVRTEARYRPFGYDHLVYVENTCDEAVHCKVSTDARPAPMDVIVRAGATAEVVTFQGSPAQSFSVSVECQKLGAR